MSEDIESIYDKTGNPILRLLENGRLVDFHGKSVGFIDSESVYNYAGRHCGWYEGGILRDHNGRCVGFGEDVIDNPHPLLPLKRFIPLPGLIESEPHRPLKEFIPLRPIKSLVWSQYTPLTLFVTET